MSQTVFANTEPCTACGHPINVDSDDFQRRVTGEIVCGTCYESDPFCEPPEDPESNGDFEEAL